MPIKRTTKFLRGTVKVTLSGPFPERVLNLCAQNNVAFWGAEKVDSFTYHLILWRNNLPAFRQLCQRCSCEITLGNEQGLFSFLSRFQKRYAFLVGLFLCLCFVSFLSQFVFFIEITGNESIPTAKILSQLRYHGLRTGVYGPHLDRSEIAQQTILDINGISFLAINLHGTRAQVVVREEIAPPEKSEQDEIFDIVSIADGIVTGIDVLSGQGLVPAGASVAKGDTLIRSAVELHTPMDENFATIWVTQSARGNVCARTWRTLTAKIPLYAEIKQYESQAKTRFQITFFNTQFNFFSKGSISSPLYDKIVTQYAPRIFDMTLPLTITKEQYRRYETQTTQVNAQAAQQMLETSLCAYLDTLLGETGECISQSFSAQIKDDFLFVTLQAECNEQIGKKVSAQSAPP